MNTHVWYSLLLELHLPVTPGRSFRETIELRQGFSSDSISLKEYLSGVSAHTDP